MSADRSSASGYPPIQDYAVIGDGRSLALIGKDGAIEWLCWPRVDSPSVFAAMLDRRAGRFRIGPAGAPGPGWSIERRYIGDSNVLETRFIGPDGTARLVDLMPVSSEEDKRRAPSAEHEIARRLTCETGEVRLEVEFDPRPDYGRVDPGLVDRGSLGWCFELRSGIVRLRCSRQLPLGSASPHKAELVVRQGDSIDFSLSWSSTAPAVLCPLHDALGARIEKSVEWWERWAARARYEGPYREAVIRSALVIKLLSYAPSGALLAAATTSLPERAGGELNWDYRYCWLRDSSFTVRALLGLDYREEAEAFVSWLLHTTRLTRPEVSVLYDVYGEDPRRERELVHLEGWRGSRPVRVGNLAAGQLQLDTYGELLDSAARLFADTGIDRETQRFLGDLGRFVLEHWQSPDAGIWEERDLDRHYTHSRVACWAAMDRLLKLHQGGKLSAFRVDTGKLGAARDRIREDVERRAWLPEITSYARVLGGSEVDAALLRMGWYGFHEPSDARMIGTARRIRSRLEVKPGLLVRHERSRELKEGAFGIASFWLVEHLARGGGTLAEAEAAFEQVLEYRNDVGLYAEEIDPETNDALGNFPQAYTHVGVISAALAIEERRRREPGGRRSSAPPAAPARTLRATVFGKRR